MSTHENTNPTEAIEPGSDRSFGFVVGGILSAIGIYQYVMGSTVYGWILAPGAMLVLLGIVVPRILRPLNLAWMWLGILLGRIITPVIMLLVFIVSIVPIGLLLRLFGKDSLKLRPATEEVSYWIERSPPGPPPESLNDQF